MAGASVCGTVLALMTATGQQCMMGPTGGVHVATLRVPVQPRLLRWARERAGLEIADLQRRFPRYPQWEEGTLAPTLRQLERLAGVARVPLGYLFLASPPRETLPVPDYRSVAGRASRPRPSPELLDTLRICRERQDWFRNRLRELGEKPLSFVRSVTLADDADHVAATIRRRLGFDVGERRGMGSWSLALRRFVEQVESIGVLVMISGVVGNNTHRPLGPDEFRGFAMVDDLAPLIFVNGADSRAAQIFTLAHELAHVWLGESALSDLRPESPAGNRVERWCNRVAAELLVPAAELERRLDTRSDPEGSLGELARTFKVSTLVVLCRLRDLGFLPGDRFRDLYAAERERWRSLPRGAGGNFFNTLPVRTSKRFTRELIASTLEGRTLYRDALRMLGIRKQATFRDLGESLGVL